MKHNHQVPITRILKAFIALPSMVIVFIPLILHKILPVQMTTALFSFPGRIVVTMVLGTIGLGLLYSTNFLFSKEGHGTLAPWSPPDKLVIKGPYRYMRQPMIGGVLLVLFSEIILLATWASGIWFGLFLAANLVYIPLLEEKALIKRFGEEYRHYQKEVPGWIPRLHPWNGKE